jgi:tripartite-type tricarboxylate transporter receptor subunit TctC
MKRSTLIRGLAALSATATLSLGLASTAAAQAANDFPNRSIELLVPYQPGGGTDGLARAFSEASRKHISQSIVIVNRPGW